MTIEVTVVSGAGLDVEVAHAGVAGTPILFLHGLGGDHSSWRPQLEGLAANHRVAAWTMPGYGRSVRPEPFDFDSLADVAAAVIEHFDQPAVVVGHSLGGYIAQQLALRHPDAVIALGLIGTTAAFGKPGSDFNRQFLQARLSPLDQGLTPADLAPQLVAGLVGPATGDDVRVAAVASMSAISPEAYRQVLSLLVRWDARDRLSSLRAPTICVAGTDDTTAPPAAVARLAGHIDGARYVELDGVGHLMNLEAPDRFNHLVLDLASEA